MHIVCIGKIIYSLGSVVICKCDFEHDDNGERWTRGALIMHDAESFMVCCDIQNTNL
jgi:hypothetical protein